MADNQLLSYSQNKQISTLADYFQKYSNDFITSREKIGLSIICLLITFLLMYIIINIALNIYYFINKNKELKQSLLCKDEEDNDSTILLIS